MAVYEVYTPPSGSSDSAEAARFIRDGNSLWALIVPGLWLLWHSLWLELAAYIALQALLIFLGNWGLAAVAIILSILPGLYLFLEGSRHLAARLVRHGWCLAGIIEANDLDSAEAKWFTALPQTAALATNQTPIKATGARSIDPLGRPEFGMFAEG